MLTSLLLRDFLYRSLSRANEKEAQGQPPRAPRSESVRGRGTYTYKRLLSLLINPVSWEIALDDGILTNNIIFYLSYHSGTLSSDSVIRGESASEMRGRSVSRDKHHRAQSATRGPTTGTDRSI